MIYLGVDLEQIWKTVQRDVPQLKAAAIAIQRSARET